MFTQIDDFVMNVYAFWSPIYLFLVFLVLERKKAYYDDLTQIGKPPVHQPMA